MLLMIAMPTAYADIEADKNLYEGDRFALGIGAAIVRFDTKLKFTDKTRTNFDSIFIDPEGTLGLPETSSITTFYAAWSINPRHSISASYFSVDRESSLLNIDETFEDIRVVGNAKISDNTNFYRVNYGYALFNDERSKINLAAGIYGLDLKYAFEAQGQITQDGMTTSGTIKEEANVFAPLPEEKVHAVEEGDTLFQIAIRHLERTHRWEEIWKINEVQVPNPHRIFPGQKSLLP